QFLQGPDRPPLAVRALEPPRPRSGPRVLRRALSGSRFPPGCGKKEATLLRAAARRRPGRLVRGTPVAPCRRRQWLPRATALPAASARDSCLGFSCHGTVEPCSGTNPIAFHRCPRNPHHLGGVLNAESGEESQLYD